MESEGPKRKRIRIVTKKWKFDEENMIIDYIKTCYQNNIDIENIIEPPLKRFRRHLKDSTPKKKNYTSNSTVGLAEAQKIRGEALVEKNKIEKYRVEQEISLATQKFMYEKETFEVDTNLRKQELDIKLKELESKERIRKMELEHEERIETLKLSMQFNLKKEKY